jgi:putative heme-binding domain-containing protein
VRNCHKFGDIGLRDVGPPLAGIGAKGPQELLTHIVDPNRQVEPNLHAMERHDEERRNAGRRDRERKRRSLTLRNQGGDTEVKKDDIATRDNTRRSLMPEGLEGLGTRPARSRDVPRQREFRLHNSLARTAPPSVAGQIHRGSDPDTGPRKAAATIAAAPGRAVEWEPGKVKVLLIGWRQLAQVRRILRHADTATLKAAGYSVNYTEDRDQAAAELAGADVAVSA